MNELAGSPLSSWPSATWRRSPGRSAATASCTRRPATWPTLLAARGLTDWDGFAASWNDLGVDAYMADGGRYRRRRHAALSMTLAGDIRRKPHQPHYQSRDYNPLNGGIARWFDPVTEAIAAHPALHAILRLCLEVFTGCTPPATRPASWHVELHQFRVETRADMAGNPTPEGLHRDGVDWVLVLLVRAPQRRQRPDQHPRSATPPSRKFHTGRADGGGPGG